MIFAYLDPGSGSLLLQAVIGGLAGLGVAVKAFRSRFSRGGDVAPTEEEADRDVEPTPTEP